MTPKKVRKKAVKAGPISLAPLSAEQVLGALVQMPPMGTTATKPPTATRKASGTKR